MRRLAAQRLLPGEGDDIELGEVELLREGSRRRVADRQALAVGSDPVGVRHAHAGGRAVPGEDDVIVAIHFREVGEFAVAALERARVLQLQLLDDVGHPAFAKTFPGEQVDRAGAEQRPERHFDRARVGGRHDADAIIRGNLKNLAGEVDGELQLALADLGAVRTAERRVFQGFEGPAGALGAGAGRKIGVRRPEAGHRIRHIEPSFQMGASRWGEVSRGRR